MNAHFMQQGEINCPVCNQDKDSLTVWHNMDGIAFCACEECLAAEKLPVVNNPGTKRFHPALLKVGFRAGYDKAINEMRNFLQKAQRS